MTVFSDRPRGIFPPLNIKIVSVISSNLMGTHQTLKSVQEKGILHSISKISNFRLTESSNY